jgi:hypothetical protein
MKANDSRQTALVPSLEEFQRSHFLLEALVALLPQQTQKELVHLLETLSKGHLSEEASDSLQQRALKIVSQICKQPQIPEQAPAETGPKNYQKRMGDRRERERRQQPANSGKPWTAQQEQILISLAEQNIPVRRIALRLGRTSTAVQSKAKEMQLSLN